MATYTINLLDGHGVHQEACSMPFDDDDAAIDHVGGIAHPHAIDVWQGQRHVAHFPPWQPLGLTSRG